MPASVRATGPGRAAHPLGRHAGHPRGPAGARDRDRRGRRVLRTVAAAALAAGLLVALNWGYQMLRKPSELLALPGLTAARSPRETWQVYGPLFREHSTSIMSAPLLAALVQAESQGDPLARTYWRWRWSWNPLAWFAPASSAVGILQITDGAFQEARQYCIHDHRVVRVGPWYDPRTCWLNGLYTRVIPSHAIEMTAARLHRTVEDTLAEARPHSATLVQKQDLAAVVHLCGARAGAAYARRGFRPAPGQRCGDHGLREYLMRVRGLAREFARLEVA